MHCLSLNCEMYGHSGVGKFKCVMISDIGPDGLEVERPKVADQLTSILLALHAFILTSSTELRTFTFWFDLCLLQVNRVAELLPLHRREKVNAICASC